MVHDPNPAFYIIGGIRLIAPKGASMAIFQNFVRQHGNVYPHDLRF
jgi:hypothetical protein